jgi:hypothetical protein
MTILIERSVEYLSRARARGSEVDQASRLKPASPECVRRKG